MSRIVLLVSLLAAALPARAASEDEALGHVLALIQTFVRIGTQSNPEQGVTDILAGRNAEANRAMAGLFEGVTAEMPPQYRDRVASIGRDLISYAAKNPVVATVDKISVERSLQARKDLNAMGLKYYDDKHFLDAVKRNDALAVELFIAGRGVSLGAKTWDGRNAVDIARDNGNGPLADLLARNLPVTR
jgi:hypothetical protein